MKHPNTASKVMVAGVMAAASARAAADPSSRCTMAYRPHSFSRLIFVSNHL
jgi:hypothetical protein